MELQTLKEIQKNLKLEIPYKWRVQSFSKKKTKATCVAYVDSRGVQDVLDEHCQWSDRYYEVDGKLFCEITIYADGREYKRSDTGSESNQDKEKGHSSDAFKRAAVKFGVGRFLYSIKIQYVDSNEIKTTSNYPFVVDSYKKKVWDITKLINDRMTKKTITASIAKDLPILLRMNGKEINRDWNRAIATLKEGKDLDYLRKRFVITEEMGDLLEVELKQSA